MSNLIVREIFPTIQGEGPNTGQPAVFVRLAGCPLKCTFCDTDFQIEKSTEYPVKTLLDEVLAIAQSRSIRLIVITGGEPLKQDLSSFLYLLTGTPYRVQVETSGVVDQALPHWCEVVLSPKTTKINYSGHVTAWKYIIRAGDVYPGDGLPYATTQPGQEVGGISPVIPSRGRARALLARPTGHTPVYVQPCDEKMQGRNADNLSETLASVKHFGYNLSLQIHKQIGWE